MLAINNTDKRKLMEEVKFGEFGKRMIVYQIFVHKNECRAYYVVASAEPLKIIFTKSSFLLIH